MNTILHIIPHFGGGAGIVLTALIDGLAQGGLWKQEVICFEYLNSFGKEWALKTTTAVYSEISPDDPWLHEYVQSADIVHVHFWNHPATYSFLYHFSGKPARMVFWAHVNGHHVPYLFNDIILDYPELFVVASDYSLKVPLLEGRSDDWKQSHLRSVTSSSGTRGFESIQPKSHEHFNIGYIGTVDYCKMHPSFIDMCAGVNVPDLRVIVCGGNCHNEIRQEALQKNVSNIFDFRGPIANVHEVLSELDLFVYPLQQDNYGTGEQVLIEAMSAGIPQIVLNNGPESFVIQDGVTGFVANSHNEFTMRIEQLFHDKSLRSKMACASKGYALSRYSMKHTVLLWESVYIELLRREKRCPYFPHIPSENIASELFLTALGDSKESDIYRRALRYYPNKPPNEIMNEFQFMPLLLQKETRGSISHYCKFIDDPKLNFLKEISG